MCTTPKAKQATSSLHSVMTRQLETGKIQHMNWDNKGFDFTKKQNPQFEKQSEV